MALRIAINGFGRIGRLCLRSLIESGRDDIELIAINDLGPVDTNAHLLKYDSVHGVLQADVSATDNTITVNGKSITCTAERNPKDLPWGELNIDIVYECTGLFKEKSQAQGHLDAGAKKVLISAPGKNADLSVVYGINHDQLTNEHKIVSNASCTTNCLAPVADVLHKLVGIEKGYMTTVHAYTGDQHTVDKLHKDLHRARAANMSMIPTTSGATKALGLVLPELSGKIDGCAIRVPTPNVSLIDLTFDAGRATSVEEINSAIVEAANGRLKGVLGANELPLVSIDFNHNPNSSSFDLTQTSVIGGTFVRVLAWYDNEWGFANRMLDTSIAMANTGL
ncbi:Glyceraldehyde-3-phosphate dehydrogenase [Candidatus Terasakiella magnetica]|uniref:Glyceraldehyde-3-phosphate dehydrogenase n=1 Tax=Candidatus Terasakiella magnetica TaxID=1867952 RepID=A0A1C3RHN3_9PROT|nr:type I glyceraldehyde-3-phosphate dehydrogenase [Candidatus Terasakiella magnetica]SCA56788.1 Glyceraldehyde-3-phosphate dehydrogenase [Candidatus Terasakiella magnetica]